MNTTVPAPGIYRDMDAETYHATWPCLSSTGARKLIDGCAARFDWDRRNPPESSDALDFGTLAHAYRLERDKVKDRYVVLPSDHSGSTKEGKARIADIVAAGKKPIKFDDWQAVVGMAAALDDHPFAGKLFANGRAEVSLFWEDAATGINCRARTDWLPAKGAIVTDYKTTRSAKPDDLQKSVYEFGYYQQAAWYRDGLKALGVIDDPQFVFCFQEKVAPYLIVVATVSPFALEWGRLRNHKAREIFAQCIKSGTWPGYADDVLTLDLPGWATRQLEQQQAAGFYEPSAVAAE